MCVRLAMFFNLGEVVLCRRCPVHYSSALPSGYLSYMLLGFPLRGVHESFCLGRLTMWVVYRLCHQQVWLVARPCLVQILLYSRTWPQDSWLQNPRWPEDWLHSLHLCVKSGSEDSGGYCPLVTLGDGVSADYWQAEMFPGVWLQVQGIPELISDHRRVR